MAQTLKEQVESSIKENNIDSKAIQSFLFLIADNTLNDKSVRDSKNTLIRALFKEGFEAHDPSGTFKIGSKVIQQCLWRVMSKVKFLDYNLHATGKDESTERLSKEGLQTVMDRGNLSQAFRDKGGVFKSAFLYGDGFLFFGMGENDENPVSYRALRNEDVYADNFAFGVRGVRPANKMTVIYSYDKEEAYDLWPDLAENEIFGRIPGTYQDDERNMDREDKDILEVAWGYNRSTKTHVQFAGAQAHEIDEFSGEEYPFMKNDKAFIPVFQFICQPSADGFWNYGIGDMVFDLAVITRKLLNMEVTHLEENTLPMTLINAPAAKVDELVEKMAMANKARAHGKKPFVAMEFDPAGGQQSVAAQALITQNLFNEWQAVWDRLYNEISRLGINLDDVDRGSGFTATQIYAEEETANDFIRQMQEYNASETKELLECSIDAVTEFVSNGNKTELNLRTKITLPDQSTIKTDKKVTMGMLSKEFKTNNYFVEVNARQGVNKSDLMKITHLKEKFAITPPGTPEFAELYRLDSELRGLDINLVNQPEAVPAGGGAASPAPTPTAPGIPNRVTPDVLAAAEAVPI